MPILTPPSLPSLTPLSPPSTSDMEVDCASDPSVLTFKGTAATLHLSDKTSCKGYSFGGEINVAGEVVFNTGMVGYPEALTDPSYRGQILVLTFPLIGNYGVPDETEMDKWGLPVHFESRNIHIAGLIVSSYSWEHSHWTARSSLASWLKKHNVPAMYGVDTRALTKKIRDAGAFLGKIEHDSLPR